MREREKEREGEKEKKNDKKQVFFQEKSNFFIGYRVYDTKCLCSAHSFLCVDVTRCSCTASCCSWDNLFFAFREGDTFVITEAYSSVVSFLGCLNFARHFNGCSRTKLTFSWAFRLEVTNAIFLIKMDVFFVYHANKKRHLVSRL